MLRSSPLLRLAGAAHRLGSRGVGRALAGVDLVIFDSSRLMLSAAGLAEDSNDDYARSSTRC